MSRVSDLLAQARAAASLEDFGEDSFREGLEILVASADTQARFNAQGEQFFNAQVVSFLSQRLQVQYWFTKHPEIDEQEIVAPLIGLGLPRTGSTALGCLLAEDPAVRSIRSWEVHAPCPPPETATEHTDPRIADAVARQEAGLRLAPRLRSMLPSSPTSPSECQQIMGQDFKSHVFQAWGMVPDYSEWLHHKADLEPTYRHVKKVLKLLQWRCPPNRWRLKNPSHMVFIESLDKVFPDARYWMTHRDITSVIPSVTDLYYELCKGLSDHVDAKYLARLNTECWEVAMHRLIAFRDAGRDDRFFDIYFESFQKDPFPRLAQLYEFLGEPFTDEARRRMEAWRRDTPRDKHGLHTVDPAAFGIDIPALRERFRFYSERFNVPQAT